ILEVARIQEVLEVVEEVRRPHVGVRVGEDPFLLEGRHARERRRLALAEVREDQAERLARRVGAERDLLAKRFRLGRLLDALPVIAELPAVIEATDTLALDGTRGE